MMFDSGATQHTHTRTGAVLNTATPQLSSTLGVHQLELDGDSLDGSLTALRTPVHWQKELQLVQRGNFLLMGCQLWDYSTYMATLRDDYSAQQQLHCWDLGCKMITLFIDATPHTQVLIN